MINSDGTSYRGFIYLNLYLQAPFNGSQDQTLFDHDIKIEFVYLREYAFIAAKPDSKYFKNTNTVHCSILLCSVDSIRHEWLIDLLTSC